MVEKRNRVINYFLNGICVLIAMFHFVPVYILLTVSFKNAGDFSSRWLPPSYLDLTNYIKVFEDGKILTAFGNSIIVTLCSIVIVLFCGAACAYPLARIKRKLSSFIINMVLAVMMIPSLSVIVPLYTNMLKIGAVNTYWGIILVLSAYNLPMSVFLFTNFIRTISPELDEAAAIDGCKDSRIFFKVIMPQLQPVVASVLILTGVKIWNDYKYALYFLQKSKLETITLYISKFFSDFSVNLNMAAAAAVLAILPVCLLFIFLQKYFISGLSEGSIK